MKKAIRSFLGKLFERFASYSPKFAGIASEQSGHPVEVDAVLAETAIVEATGGVLNMTGDPGRIHIGENSQLAGRIILYPNGSRVSMGDWCYIGQRSEIWAMTEVSIGDRVFLSHDVNVHDTNSHSLDPTERHEHFRYYQEHGSPSDWKDLPGVSAEPIVIEDDCWLGFGVTVFKGVTIGKGSVIAARSIVTKDVPPGSFYRNSFEPVITPLAASSRAGQPEESE